MAQLKSEDLDTLSYFELLDEGRDSAHPEQVWQRVIVKLRSGARLISVGESTSRQDCLLCREPQDEIGRLLYLLNEVSLDQLDKFSFEPQEPCFELSIERSLKHGLQVEVWLDAGNAERGIYTWDAAGIRFHTNEENLASFIAELEQEFPC